MKKGYIFVFSMILIIISSVFNTSILGTSIEYKEQKIEKMIDSTAFETISLEYDYENQNPPTWIFNPNSIDGSYVSFASAFIYDIDTMKPLENGDEIFRNNSEYRSVYYAATIYYDNFTIDTNIEVYDWYVSPGFAKIDWSQKDLHLGLGISYVLPSDNANTKKMFFLDPESTPNSDNFVFDQIVNKQIPSEVSNLNIINISFDGFDISFDYLKNDGNEAVKIKVNNGIIYDQIPNDGNNIVNYNNAISNQNYTIEIYLNDVLTLTQNITSKNKPISIENFQVQKVKDNYDYPQIIDEANGIANAILNLTNEDSQTINDMNFKLYDQDNTLLNENSSINEIHEDEYLFTFSDLKKGTYFTEVIIDYSNNDGSTNIITSAKIEFVIDEIFVDDPTINFFNINIEMPNTPNWNDGTINLDYELVYDDTEIEINSKDFTLYKNGTILNNPTVVPDLVNKTVAISNLEEGIYQLDVNINFKYISDGSLYSISYMSPDFMLDNKEVITPIISNNNLTTTNITPNGLVLGSINGDIILNDSTNIVDNKVKLNLFNSNNILLKSIEKDVIANSINVDGDFTGLQLDNYKIQILGELNVGIGVNEEREIGVIENITIEQNIFRIPELSISSGIDSNDRLWFQMKSLETENFWLDVREIRLSGTLFYKNFIEKSFDIHKNFIPFELQTFKITNPEVINDFLDNIMFVDLEDLSVRGINTNWEQIESFSVNINSEIPIKQEGNNIEPSAPIIFKQQATENSIYIEWTKSIDDVMVDYYLVQIGTSDAIIVNALSYEFTNLEANRDYYVRVAAVDDQGALGISPTVKITTLESTSTNDGDSFWWFLIVILTAITGLIVWSTLTIRNMRNVPTPSED